MNSSSDRHLQQFIRHLATASATIALYDRDHEQVLKLCLQALEQLKIVLATTPPIDFKVVDNRLIFNDRPVAANLSTERLVSNLNTVGVSSLKIEAGISAEELLILADTLAARPGTTDSLKKTEHIRYGRVEVRYRSAPQAEAQQPEPADFSAISETQRDRFMEIYRDVRNRKQVNIVGIAEIVSRFLDAFESHSQVLLALAPLRERDEYAYTHSTNICLLNLAQARLLGLSGPLLNEIGIAAMLHDVGKMFIPTEILNKPGQLDEREWQIMRSHPRLGAEYLQNAPGISHLAVVTAYEHHIGYDGTGYPATAHRWRLSPCSYMTAISDVYDALRTRRSYKEPLSYDTIRAIMVDSAGKSLHPELTRSFLEALDPFEKEPS